MKAEKLTYRPTGRVDADGREVWSCEEQEPPLAGLAAIIANAPPLANLLMSPDPEPEPDLGGPAEKALAEMVEFKPEPEPPASWRDREPLL